jgi:peptide/nickel transport system substrate-binding protein
MKTTPIRLRAISSIVALLVTAAPVAAQTRAETLRHVTGSTINTLNPALLGATSESLGFSVNVYDRLVTFERKKVGEGWVFEPDRIRGELAESYEVSPDGLKITFKLRRDAKWHDGSPVTVEDVKWSLDRAVSSKSLAAPQLATGSLTRPEQFKIIDERTIEVTLDQPDRLALPNLATPYVIMINSKVAKQHVTPDDPWAENWLKENTAGSGAYMVEAYKPGEQVILRRNEGWKSGSGSKLPFFKRIIVQTVPEAATRANLVERGDADLSIDLQASDVTALQQRGKVKLVSTPQFNAFTMVVFNTRMPPFDNVKVRQAIAAALPYKDMFQAAIFGRGNPLFGATWKDVPAESKFPQALPVQANLEKAKQLLTEAGFPNGFETTFSFSTGSAATSEPMAALIKEALGKIGINVNIQKLPDAQMGTLQAEKKLPFLTESSIAYLSSTDYFFRSFFQGESRWNFSSWDNPEVSRITAKARFEQDQAKYEEMAKRLVALAAEEMPVILLWQANQDALMAPSIDGFTYWFHRKVDYRDLLRK